MPRLYCQATGFECQHRTDLGAEPIHWSETDDEPHEKDKAKDRVVEKFEIPSGEARDIEGHTFRKGRVTLALFR
jgi:hypothetical protein